MKRPTPPYRSLIENPKWTPVICRRCERTFWLEPCKVGTVHYCTKDCRYESPEKVIEKTTTKGQGPKGECWNCSLTPSAAYPQIKIKGVSFRVSRLVLEKKLGRPIGHKLEALHSCDNTRCIFEGHLSEDTHQENIRGAVERGRLDDRRGIKCPNHKLTEEQARDIKFNPRGLSGKELAALYDVWPSRITMIQQGKQWSHLQP